MSLPWIFSRPRRRWAAIIPLAGLLFAWGLGHSSPAFSRSGQEKEEKDCPLCQETARIKKEFDAGRMPKVEWIDRRLALLEGEYLTNRLGILEEKEKAQEPELKAGRVSLGETLDTKLEIVWLRSSLKKIGDAEFKKRREELASTYRKWLKEQLEAAKMGQEEYQKRLSRLSEDP